MKEQFVSLKNKDVTFSSKSKEKRTLSSQMKKKRKLEKINAGSKLKDEQTFYVHMTTNR